MTIYVQFNAAPFAHSAPIHIHYWLGLVGQLRNA